MIQTVFLLKKKNTFSEHLDYFRQKLVDVKYQSSKKSFKMIPNSPDNSGKRFNDFISIIKITTFITLYIQN